MKRNLEQRSGITLIALVITIGVLLILAGVTIATLTGENGILTKANQAKEKKTQGEAEDKIRVALNGWMIEKYTGKMTLEEFLKKEFDLQEELKKDEDGNLYIPIGDYTAIVGADGELKGIGETKNIALGPEIVKIELTSTVNSINVKTEAKNAENATYTYYIGSTEENLEEKASNGTGEYEFSGLMPSTTYYVKVRVKTSVGMKEKTESKITVANALPTILNDEVKVSEKTPTSLKIQAKATDEDGDKITYKLYFGEELKATSEQLNSGEVATFQVDNLSNYTEYTYHVTASDAYETATSEIKVGKTQCPGNTLDCTSGYSCNSGWQEYCAGNKCGTWLINCPDCGRGMQSGFANGGFTHNCTNGVVITLLASEYAYCPTCKTKYDGNTWGHYYICKHGEYHYHYIDHKCRHGYTSAHSQKCSHDQTSSHKYCDHNANGVAHD